MTLIYVTAIASFYRTHVLAGHRGDHVAALKTLEGSLHQRLEELRLAEVDGAGGKGCEGTHLFLCA